MLDDNDDDDYGNELFCSVVSEWKTRGPTAVGTIGSSFKIFKPQSNKNRYISESSNKAKTLPL